MCGEQRQLQGSVFKFYLALRQGLFDSLHSRTAACEFRRLTGSCLISGAPGLEMRATTPGSKWVLVFHACAAADLPSELSPQLLAMFLKCFFILFYFNLFKDRVFLCNRLALNLQQSSCISLSSTGIQSMHHHTWLEMFNSHLYRGANRIFAHNSSGLNTFF